MKLPTKVRYAARVMVELAEAGPDQTVSSRELAERQDISKKYLEQILAALKGAGLVLSFKGSGGGYTLSRSPARINLGHIYRTFEGSLSLVDCVDEPTVCPRHATCATREAWVELSEALRSVMDNTTLQDLLDRRLKKSRGRERVYHI